MFSYDPRLVFNVDETFISVKEHKLNVAVHRDISGSRKQLVGHVDYHMTLINTCCAYSVGGLADVPTPTIILPGKNVPTFTHPSLQILWNWAGSDSGWITDEIWVEWIQTVFIPFIAVRRSTLIPPPTNSKVLLWSDGHQSRLQLEALDWLTAENIQLVLIPPHTSHILQPLDCGIHYKFKKELSAGFVKICPLGKITTATYRTHLLTAAHSALYCALNPLTVEHAWRATGLFPFDPNHVLKDTAKVHNGLAGELTQQGTPDDDPQKPEPLQGTILLPSILRERRAIREAKKAAEEAEKKKKKDAKAARKAAKEAEELKKKQQKEVDQLERAALEATKAKVKVSRAMAKKKKGSRTSNLAPAASISLGHGYRSKEAEFVYKLRQRRRGPVDPTPSLPVL